MINYQEYTDLSRQIHAPTELKNKVLMEAQQYSGKKEKAFGQFRRGWSLVQKAAVAAILAVILPVTAYAAARYLGLADYLAKSGMEETQAVQELSSGLLEEKGYRNSFAEYTVLEAVCDSQVIYIAAKITPLDENHLLVPQFVMEDEFLEIDGEIVGTVSEYAASQGKSLVYADVGYFNGESHLDGSVGFQCAADGTLYYYYTVQNTFESNDIRLRCAGVAYTDGMSLAERVEFEVDLFDKSTSTAKSYTVFDQKVVSETGIVLNSLTIEETELGLYATFNFDADGYEAWRDCFSIQLLDAAGNPLRNMPNLGYGVVDNGDGTCSITLAYQKPDTTEGLQFIIRNYVDDIEYGPYAFA